MAGIIVGVYGYQRSGKTLLAYLLAKSYHARGIPVYTNMDCPDFNKIERLSDIPLNNNCKVLLLDEVYSFLDSRNWQSNTNTSLFFNTIGKQNILLLMTAINLNMIEMRLRQQHNYLVLVKGSDHYITYKSLDCIQNKASTFTIPKTQELFDQCNYNTLQVPDVVDCNLDNFISKVKKYNLEMKGGKGM